MTQLPPVENGALWAREAAVCVHIDLLGWCFPTRLWQRQGSGMVWPFEHMEEPLGRAVWLWDVMVNSLLLNVGVDVLLLMLVQALWGRKAKECL